MDQAMAGNSLYFNDFYYDLSKRRFSLIVSEILSASLRKQSYSFGEENNYWVQYVSGPLLFYYEPLVTLQDVGVQLLILKNEPVDCH